MSGGEWNAFDEGYASAYRWAKALAGGAALPIEEAPVQLEPGEVAHAHLAPVTFAAYIATGFEYQPIFGIFVTGEVALGRRADRRAEATRAAHTPRWHGIATVEVTVTNQRLIATGSGKTGALAYGEAGPLQLAPGLDGGPAVEFQPAGSPALQLASPWAPLLYVFARTVADGRPPAVPIPPAVLARAKAEDRLA
jgi:hypothetical protein